MRIIFSAIISLMLFFNTAFAWELPFTGTTFIEAAKYGDVNGIINSVDEGLGNGLVNMLNLLYVIGDIVAICILVFMGLQAILASPQKKADLKASLAPYFIGLLLYIAGVPIAVAIINIFIKIF